MTHPATLIELSHDIEDGMITYKGLPAPVICDHLSRAAVANRCMRRARNFRSARSRWSRTPAPTSTVRFIASNTASISPACVGVDHRIAGLVVRVLSRAGRAISATGIRRLDVAGKAVLVHTGWAAHWRTDQYFEGHPFLTKEAAEYLRDAGATLVGIDSYNIDDTGDGQRPVHTALLGAGIPIVEHMRGLEQLPDSGFRFSAVPPKIKGMGTFPVRAYATLDR